MFRYSEKQKKCPIISTYREELPLKNNREFP